jgi:hypothetical protein
MKPVVVDVDMSRNDQPVDWKLPWKPAYQKVQSTAYEISRWISQENDNLPTSLRAATNGGYSFGQRWESLRNLTPEELYRLLTPVTGYSAVGDVHTPDNNQKKKKKKKQNVGGKIF